MTALRERWNSVAEGVMKMVLITIVVGGFLGVVLAGAMIRLEK